MAIRNYTSAAPSTTLSGAITNVATSITVASASGYPSAPFVAIINRDLADEEAVYVSAKAGTTWTVTRGYDGTTALSHLSGAKVEHGVTAIEFREANAHVNATGDTHGIGGSIKGYIDGGDATAISTAGSTASAALTAHGALTSGTHGLTSVLSRLTATEGVANTASSTATTANTTANTATSNLAAHIADTTGVHGVAGTLGQARYCSVRQSAAVAIAAGGGWTNIGMNTEWADTQGWHTGTQSGVRPTESGIYLVCAGLTWATTDQTGYRASQIIVNNGSDLLLASHVASAQTTNLLGVAQTLSAICWVNGTTDYFALRADQWNSGVTSQNILADTAWITVARLGAQ